MLSKLFGFDPSKHNIKTEVMAGITTFLTMAYILAVNPSIFSNLADKGMDTNAVFTATALAAIIGTLAMAIYAKKPFGLAPGMGLNAFFVFTVCLTMGYSWQFALTAILIEGFIFVVLTLTKVRTLIVDAIPASVKRAIGAGIGLFIAFIGLKNAGIIVENSATFVTIGTMTEGTALLGVIGIVLTSVLVIKNVPGSLLIGILATALIGIPMGVTHFSGVVDTPPSVAPLFCQFEFHHIFTLDMLVVVFTFLFIDMFDTMGTLVGVCTKAGMMQKDGRIPGLNKAFMADAVATNGWSVPRRKHHYHLRGECGRRSAGRTQRSHGVLYGCVLRRGYVLRSVVPLHTGCCHHSGARHRGSVHAHTGEGHRPRRLCRVDTGVHHHRDDAAHVQHLRRHPLRCHLVRAYQHALHELEEAQPHALCAGCAVHYEVHLHLTSRHLSNQYATKKRGFRASLFC